MKSKWKTLSTIALILLILATLTFIGTRIAMPSLNLLPNSSEAASSGVETSSASSSLPPEALIAGGLAVGIALAIVYSFIYFFYIAGIAFGLIGTLFSILGRTMKSKGFLISAIVFAFLALLPSLLLCFFNLWPSYIGASLFLVAGILEIIAVKSFAKEE